MHIKQVCVIMQLYLFTLIFVPQMQSLTQYMQRPFDDNSMLTLSFRMARLGNITSTVESISLLQSQRHRPMYQHFARDVSQTYI